MPSTYITEPTGPRSVDDMLAVVHTRADRMRRRRTTQRVGVTAVAVLVGAAGFVTMRGGEPNAQVNVVDRPDSGEEAIAPPSVDASTAPVEGAQVSATAAQSSKEAGKPHTVDATVGRPEAVPPIPTEAAPSLDTWADDADGVNDSTPTDWYFDISTTAMQFDSKAQVVVFRTSYRAPDAVTQATRASRILESRFDYEGQTFAVYVNEADNQFGAVRLDNLFDCTDCSTAFDVAGSTLVVNVPLGSLNQAVTRRASPLAAGADIMSLEAWTFRADGTVKLEMADTSDMEP